MSDTLSGAEPPAPAPLPAPPAPAAGVPAPMILGSDAALTRVLHLVDTVVDKGREQTLKVERAARVTRRLPALLFGVTLAVAGLGLLTLALLRGTVEATDLIFDGQRAWVAWLVLAGILFVVAVFIGTTSNKGSLDKGRDRDGN